MEHQSALHFRNTAAVHAALWSTWLPGVSLSRIARVDLFSTLSGQGKGECLHARARRERTRKKQRGICLEGRWRRMERVEATQERGWRGKEVGGPTQEWGSCVTP